MKKSIICLLIFSFAALSCAKVPVTGRRQLNLISASKINSMSFTSYKDFLNEHKLSNNTKQVQTVKRVGQRIQKAVEQFAAQDGWSDQLEGYKWEFNLVDDPAVNAWCMPGGKVVVYTGIMPIVKDENGLAVVMGHEIAHAIANHGNERMSQGLVAQTGFTLISVALEEKPEETQNLFLAAFGAGAQVGVLLPFSRKHESEADHLGLIFMAIAGYDPNSAVDFWQRMAGLKGAKAPSEFLSTHPSDQTRINKIKSWMPEAMKYYNK